MATKLSYRPSSIFVARTNVIHVVFNDSNQTACGRDVKEFKKIYNLVIQLEKIQDPMFCKQCKQAYHGRDEDKFGLVK